MLRLYKTHVVRAARFMHQFIDWLIEQATLEPGALAVALPGASQLTA